MGIAEDWSDFVRPKLSIEEDSQAQVQTTDQIRLGRTMCLLQVQ